MYPPPSSPEVAGRCGCAGRLPRRRPCWLAGLVELRGAEAPPIQEVPGRWFTAVSDGPDEDGLATTTTISKQQPMANGNAENSPGALSPGEVRCNVTHLRLPRGHGDHQLPPHPPPTPCLPFVRRNVIHKTLVSTRLLCASEAVLRVTMDSLAPARHLRPYLLFLWVDWAICARLEVWRAVL